MILYDIIYYIYILLFGAYISIRISCNKLSAREWKIYSIACPSLLLLQGSSLQLFGFDRLWLIYPLITHLPMILILILFMNIRWDRAILAVVISYSICQLTRWIGLIMSCFITSRIILLLIHLSLSQLLLILMAHYCLPSVYNVLIGMTHPLLGFGLLPLAYYIFEYFMLFTGHEYSDILALSEFLPTSLVLFFLLFAIIYQHEMEKRLQAESLADALEVRLMNISTEIEALRMVEEKNAIYRHDLRHHLMLINSLINSGNSVQATDYIHEITQGIEKITPKRFCDNEVVNLLLAAFNRKTDEYQISLNVKTNLPEQIHISDAEICTILSNSLENAIVAVKMLDNNRNIDVYCGIRHEKLLIEVTNPYSGKITMDKGMPVSSSEGHGYGCRSIQSIVTSRRGICTFTAQEGVFILRIVIPITRDK